MGEILSETGSCSKLQLVMTLRQRWRTTSGTRKGTLERLRLQSHLAAYWFGSIPQGGAGSGLGWHSLLGLKHSHQQKHGI